MKRECSTENDFLLYVGLDWGTEFHQACVLDASGKQVHKSKIGHNGQAIADFVRLIVDTASGKPERVAVAIEVPRGPHRGERE